MAFKCRICGANDVERQGDICELCAISQDPYAANLSGIQSESYTAPKPYSSSECDSSQSSSSYIPRRSNSRKVLLNGGNVPANRDPYGNDITPSPQTNNTAVRVYSPGQTPTATSSTQPASEPVSAPVSVNQPITSGIVKNLAIDSPHKTFWGKWFRSMFTGIPFTLDNDVVMFQVFPDYTGTSLNAVGNACDQVIVYGKVNNGSINENNDIEVYGHRDANGNVIAKMIKNKASGTIVRPERSMPAMAVWIITLLAVLVVVCTVLAIGVEGIIWAVVIVICLMNLPLIFKILGVVFAGLFSIFKRR